MKDYFNWLPNLIEFDGIDENKTKYIEAIYEIFVEEFIKQGIFFQGEKLALKRLPMHEGKEATFYHITSQGEDENFREIDFDRCARIKWPKAILESNYPKLRIWENKRKNKKNILIWFVEEDYLIVIRKNPNIKLFWTAYPLNRNHIKEKLQKEYDAYKAKIAL